MKSHEGMVRLHAFLICILGLIYGLLGACSFPHRDGGEGEAIILFQTGSKAAVMPVLAPASYRLSFTGPSAIDPVIATESSVSVVLPVGVWEIDAIARDAAEKTIASGSKEVTISTGTTNVTMTLLATQNGSGSIDVTFSWPKDLSPAIASASAILRSGQTDLNSVNATSNDLAACSLRYSSQDRASGSYSLVLAYTLGSETTLRYLDDTVVNVYDNLASSATISYGKANFGQVPDPPAGLQAGEATSAVILSWDDQPSDVTGFTVERSLDGSTWGGDPLVSGNATTSYTDATATEGTTYYYRVSAINSVGTSAPCAAVSGRWASPTVTAGSLAAGTATSSSIPLSWTAATDNTTAASALEYLVFRSASNNIGTVATAQANGTIVSGWSAAMSAITASGLSASSTYWFNVLVRDAAGNLSAYTQVSGTTTAAPAVQRTIDHTNYDPSSYTDAEIQAAAALKVYFEHASTGQDIVGDSLTDSSTGYNNDGTGPCGLALFYNSSTDNHRYLCGRDHVVKGNDSTWFSTHTGLQSYMRGNPGPVQKLAQFLAMEKSMRAAVDVAMFKFCWIDIWPGVTDYVADGKTFADSLTTQMATFENNNPNIVVVYWTMPIQKEGSDNSDCFAVRQVFNDTIRAYCKANGKWLFDMADLESHDDSGEPVVDGNSNEVLWPDYAADMGHLNAAGGTKMAMAYWTLLAEIAKAKAATP